MILLIAFLTVGGMIAFVVNFLAGSGTMLNTFISSFITVSTIIVLSMIFLVCFIVSVYSAIAAVAERQSVMSSIKKSTGLLRKSPGAILLCIVLFAGAVALNAVIFGAKMPLGVIPVLGPMLSIAVSLLGAVFHSYAAVVIWASMTVYFLRSTDYPVHTADYEI
jgi:ABC-type arginine transport system permease subunit